jgi:uncharacterized hydrophobic protein (TIGR00271 family)
MTEDEKERVVADVEHSEDESVLKDVEEKASEQLGIDRWDRPLIYRESAVAATDGDLPYWLVLMLSGAIATLGLAVNSAAVVIGAMLIAPLLAPVVGLALGLAVGDGKLVAQTLLMVLLSTVAVLAVGALLTLSLPFHTITAEIMARSRPTTLDLVIAVCSGLAGVVVTVARGHRLSAAIPGVAIAVALIPPLATAGFGMGAGWNVPLIQSSLLLYGANLAGIVLSGMVVFMLIGMHRANVLKAASEWHRDYQPRGVLAWFNRFDWVHRLGLLRAPMARFGLVIGFVGVLAVPLSQTLEELTRERRIADAINAARSIFEVPDRSFVLSQRIEHDVDGTRVFLRVATAEPFGEEAEDEFEELAAERAGEPIRLVLEQLPAAVGGAATAEVFRARRAAAAERPRRQHGAEATTGLLQPMRQRIPAMIAALPLPDAVTVLGTELIVEDRRRGGLALTYAAPEPLPEQTQQVLTGLIRQTLGEPDLAVRYRFASTTPRPLDSVVLQDVAGLMRQYGTLYAEILAPEGAESAGAREVVRQMRAAEVEADRIRIRAAALPEIHLRLYAVPDPAVPPER